jgi:hypothetical protein
MDRDGVPDHIGLVETVDRNIIIVIEGNMGEEGVVGRRYTEWYDRRICGYAAPDYSSAAAGTSGRNAGRNPEASSTAVIAADPGDSQ